MKIGITTTVIQRGKTGVAQYVFALTQALLAHAHEHEITLFVLAEDVPLFAFVGDKIRLEIVGEKWRGALKNILWHQFVLPSVAKKLKLDVLHVPSYRRMIWRKPCALLSTIHDLAPFHVQGKYDPLRMFYGRVIVKYLARRQDGIIAISTNTAEDIQRFFGIPVSKQNILLNGLDHARFKPAESGSTAKVDGNLEQPYFLYVSRLEHPAKNHVRLIEAFNRFKAASGSPWLLALGGSDWHGAEVIHAAAKASPYAKDIRFLGFVSDATLPDLYRGAGAFVYPSLFEGFGLPPVEAMASGCPVISSTRGSLDEVVSEAALRIDPENIEEMAAALTTLATDENARKDLIRRGFANAKRFDWAKNGQNYLDICRLLINKYKN